jgi:hypothetical protein
MRLLNEASKLSSAAERARYSSTLWYRWKKDTGPHWPALLGWLYDPGRQPPSGIEITKAMRDVRRQLSKEAILEGARKLDPKQRGLNPQQIINWLSRYPEQQYPWLEPWLLRGAPLPEEVKLPNKRQVKDCGLAWHYAKLCSKAKPPIHRKTYPKWIVNLLVPDAWRPWLFGGDPPPGGFVVELKLQRLREEMSPAGIIGKKSADLDASTLWEWHKSPLIMEALGWAIEWAAQTGAREALTPPWPEKFRDVPTKTKNNLIRYGKAATLSACCERAGWRLDDYSHTLAKAERLGVGQLLESYVKGLPPFERKWSRARRSEQPYFGLVAENFFIPTPKMGDFRTAAQTEAGRLRLAKTVGKLKDHPGFQAWFPDWTNPRGYRTPLTGPVVPAGERKRRHKRRKAGRRAEVSPRELLAGRRLAEAAREFASLLESAAIPKEDEKSARPGTHGTHQRAEATPSTARTRAAAAENGKQTPERERIKKAKRGRRPKKAKRGRRRGYKLPRAAAKHKRIIDAAKSGQYPTISELARKLKVDRTLASKVLKNAGVTLTK